MKKDEAYEIKKLWEEIVSLEGLTEDDSFHSLEYLARRLHEAQKINYPNTVFKLYEIEKRFAYMRSGTCRMLKLSRMFMFHFSYTLLAVVRI